MSKTAKIDSNGNEAKDDIQERLVADYYALALDVRDAVITLNKDLKIIHLNEAAEDLFRVDTLQALGASYLDIASAGDNDLPEMENLARALKGEVIEVSQRNRKTGQGGWISTSYRVRPIFDEKEQVTALCVTHQDRTNEVRSKLLLHDLEEMASIGGWEMEISSRSTTWTNQMYKLFNVDLSVPANMEMISLFFSEESRKDFLNNFADSIESGKPFAGEFHIQLPKSPVKVYAAQWKVEQNDKKASRIYGTFRDNTSEHEAASKIEEQHKQLVAASKFGAIGELAAGMAHEINNPLAIVVGYVDYLVNLLEAQEVNRDKALNLVNRIGKSAKRIAGIIESLKGIAKDPSIENFTEASLLDVVNNIMQLSLERVKIAGIDLRISSLQPNHYVNCLKGQLEQVLLALLQNAIDAVSSVEEKWIEIRYRELGEKIELVIIDSGPGIPRDLEYKILEPFFTTKEVGQGTGLGLSMAKGVIESHNGTLSIDWDAPNTSIKVCLPKGAPIPFDQASESVTELTDAS